MNDQLTDWRPVLAVLANADARRVAIAVMQGTDPDVELTALSPSRRGHIRELLGKSGFITERDGALVFVESVFADILRAQSAAPRRGVERFLRDGRIETYPARPTDRAELLRHVAREVLADGEVVHEAEINDRLSRFSPDTAVLRRYLVDAGLMERRADGSEYAAVRA